MELEEKKRLARRIPEDVATGRQFGLIDDVLARGFVEHGFLGRTLKGREAVRNQIGEVTRAFPDFEAEVGDVVAEDDTVAMLVTLSGTHEAEFMGIGATGRSFEVRNTVFTRVEDGRIAERWVQPDMLDMLTQLGFSGRLTDLEGP